MQFSWAIKTYIRVSEDHWLVLLDVGFEVPDTDALLCEGIMAQPAALRPHIKFCVNVVPVRLTYHALFTPGACYRLKYF